MWILVKHIRAFLLSAALLASFFKHKDNTSVHDLLIVNGTFGNVTFNFLEGNHSENVNEIVNKRKRYRNFIVNERNYHLNDTGVYILGLFELSTKYGLRTEGISEVLAAQLAVEHVNNKSLLDGYQLKLLINDTQCDPGAGIDRFFHALYSKKTIVMLLGSGCSNVTESLANIVPYWNILQISFGSTSAVLSDRNKFPLFFRTIAPDSSLNNAKFAFIQHYKWNTVATFSQRENDYLLPLNNLVVELEKSNVSCAVSVTFSRDNFKEQLKNLKESDIRVIIGSFSSSIADRIFCEVYVLNMFGTDYVWILQEKQEIWWKNSTACVESHLAAATEGIIFLTHHSIIPENQTSISGLSNEEFQNKLNTKFASKYVRHTYDAVWAMALLLSELQKKGTDLSEFYYDNDRFVDDIINNMRSLQFMGVSGPVRFHGADRVGNSVIKQIQGGCLRRIAIHYAENNLLNFTCKKCSKIQWRDDKIPIAKRILKFKLMTIPKVAFYIILVVCLCGILVCIIFLYFNFHFRRMKVVKLSSPKLNNIAIIGCIFVYTAVILLGVDLETIIKKGNISQICTVRVYLLSAGFSLAFGSMFAKTYRVHRIFTYSCTSLVKDKILKDKQLICLILFLLIVDGIIVIFWVYINPLERNVHNLTIEISSEDRAVLYQPQVEVCRCNNTTGWFIAMYGYKGFLLIMGVYMAWETRHIQVEPLNDSQYIGICVYSAVFSSIIVLLSNFLTDYVILAYLAKTISILISATLTLLLLFLPKLKAVFWDGTQDPIIQSMGLKIECNTRRLLVDDPRELSYRMEVQNKVYKCELEALDREIARLEKLLNENPSTICNYPKLARASWPTTLMLDAQIVKNNFLSESILNEGNSITLDDRSKIIDRLRHFFGQMPSVWFDYSSNSVIDEYRADNSRGRLSEGSTSKAKSMNLVYNMPESNKKPFFISIDENQFYTRDED